MVCHILPPSGNAMTGCTLNTKSINKYLLLHYYMVNNSKSSQCSCNFRTQRIKKIRCKTDIHTKNSGHWDIFDYWAQEILVSITNNDSYSISNVHICGIMRKKKRSCMERWFWVERPIQCLQLLCTVEKYHAGSLAFDELMQAKRKTRKAQQVTKPRTTHKNKKAANHLLTCTWANISWHSSHAQGIRTTPFA